VPRIVELCVTALQKRGIEEPGIFRLAGLATRVTELRRLVQAPFQTPCYLVFARFCSLAFPPVRTPLSTSLPLNLTSVVSLKPRLLYQGKSVRAAKTSSQTILRSPH
jgi:hypothetical protein